MKNSIYILILCVLGAMLLPGTGTASICDTKETVVFFGNGIKTSEEKAYDSRDLLKQRLEAVLSVEEYELLDFKLSYNETGGALRDLFESTIQGLTLDASRFWRIIWMREFMPDWFADKLLLLATALDKSALVTNDSLQDHVSTYAAKIAEGKKVLLVAHSQGNFFGNQAYNLLDNRERQSFAMVSVANPDNNVLGINSPGAPYTTLINDKVIQAIIAAKILLPSRPMAPNTANLDESDDRLQHNFINTYMVEGSDSNVGIIADIVVTLDSLVSPPQIVETGVITVSLTWGSEPDMDLHVYEPNGTQVYWYNLEGYSGFLDRDDRSGYGPEHYTVSSCDMLERGVYHIALDYYKGDGPEIGTLQIEAGLLSRTFEISMGSEFYGSPDSPVLVANIFVRKVDNDGYEFEIY
jgi:hypothetical protein